MSKRRSSHRVNHVIAFLCAILALFSVTDARRIHRTSPLEKLVQTYYDDYSSSNILEPEDILVNSTSPAAIEERQSQLLSDGESPRVLKFMHNIYSEQFYS